MPQYSGFRLIPRPRRELPRAGRKIPHYRPVRRPDRTRADWPCFRLRKLPDGLIAVSAVVERDGVDLADAPVQQGCQGERIAVKRPVFQLHVEPSAEAARHGRDDRVLPGIIQQTVGGGKAVSIQIPVERPADYGGVKDINAARFVIAGVQLLLRRPCQKQQIQLLRRQLVRPAGSYFRSCPSPPIRAVSSSMRSSGNGGSHNGFKAMDMSFMGLSSAAARLELSAPQRRHL